MQDRVVKIPLVEPDWLYCSGRPYRLIDGRVYTTENVVRQLREHRRRNGLTSNGFCTARQARLMERRVRPSQRGNFVEVWFEDHCGDTPARFYNEDQLE